MWPSVCSTETRLVRSSRPLPQGPCTGVAAAWSATRPWARPPVGTGAGDPGTGAGIAAGSTATDSQLWPITLGPGDPDTAYACEIATDPAGSGAYPVHVPGGRLVTRSASSPASSCLIAAA